MKIMRKLFLSVLVAALVLIMSGAVLAEGDNGSVYVEYLFNGNGSLNYTITQDGSPPFVYNVNINSNPLAIGGEYAFGNFVINADYFWGDSTAKTNNVTMYSYNSYDLGMGYRLVNNDFMKLDFNALYYHYSNLYQNGDALGDMLFEYAINGFMLGIKATFNISDNFTVIAAYKTSLTGRVSNPLLESSGANLDETATYNIADLKLAYMLTANFGASFGYRSLNFNPHYTISSDESTGSIEIKNNIAGYNLGVFFKF